MPIQVQVTQTGLEASIQKAAQKAGRNLKINLGTSSKDINALSQPLGRITGQADEFTKSMEAANARVLAFGASVGILNGVVRAFKDLVSTTIEVEKSLASINAILQQNSQQINRFKNEIFEVAKNTEQTFGTVAEAALELSRQGLKAEEVTKRLNDALILSRLSGLDAANAVSGLTSAINAFNSTGITSGEVLNKLSAAAASAAVSERDLIEAIKRSGSVAVTTGVEFDELVGIVSALQQKTSRGGSVIGNSLKTIFTRIQSLENLETLQDLGVQVTDLSGNVVSSSKLIENLAGTFQQLDQQSQINLADKLVGKFQIAPFLALIEDYNSEVVTSARVTEVSFNATNEAYQRNIALNQTLSAVINEASVNFKQLANTLGEIGVTDSLKNIVSFFSGLAENIKNIVEGDGIGSDIAKGFIKGFSAVLSGPGLAIVAGIIGKLTVDLVKFGTGSLKTFFGLNRAAKEQASIQGQIASTLLSSQSIQKQILAIENSTLSVEQKRAAQAKFFTTAINEQLMKMKQMQGIAATISPAVMRGTASARKASGGFLPIGAEKSDINRGVGGAPSSAKPVVIPNFAFGGGKRGTMVANDSEYIVPNYANGGDAIFNQNMAASMGLPANAKKISAASGYIPNFARILSKRTQARRKEEAKKEAKLERSINLSDSTYSSIMLIPQLTDGELDGSHTFKKPYAGYKNAAFKYAGINKNLDKQNSKYARLMQLDKKLDDALVGAANIALRAVQPDIKPEPKSITRGSLDNLLGDGGAGAFGAMRGAFFEGIIEAISGGSAKDGKSTLDINMGDANGAILKEIFGLKGKYLRGDYKNSYAQKDKYVRQVIDNLTPTGKALKGRSASGYIPNFAGGALEDAIQREQAAGLPVNQIRINQSGKLRNAQNPMGLAVTNTRDEPTGAIPAARGYVPNFVSGAGIQQTNFKALSQSTKEVTTANRDYLGTVFAAQIALSALQGATSDAESAFGRYTNVVAKGASTFTTSAFAIQGLSTAFGGAEKGIGKFVGKLGPYGMAVAGLASAVKIGIGIYDEQRGANKALITSTARLNDAFKKAALDITESELTGREQRGREQAKTFLKSAGVQYEAAFVGAEKENLTKAIVAASKYNLEFSKTRDIIQATAKGGESAALSLQESVEIVAKIADKIGELDKIGALLEGVEDLGDVFDPSKRVKPDKQFFSTAAPPKSAAEMMMRQRIKGLPEGQIKREKIALNLQEQFGITRAEALNRIEQEAEKRREEALKKQKETQDAIDQVKMSAAKASISNAIEEAKIKLNVLSVEEKRLMQAQALNHLSLEQIINLENTVAAQKFSVETSKQLLDQTNKYLEGVKGITADMLANEEVQRLINEAIKDGNVSLDDTKGLIDGINSLLGDKISPLQESNAEALKKQLKSLIDIRDKEKENADAVKKSNDQNRIRVDMLKKAADEAARLRKNAEFDINFNLEEGRMEFEEKQRKLDLSKVGASQQAILGKDIQKAQNAREQALKENAARNSKLIAESMTLYAERTRLSLFGGDSDGIRIKEINRELTELRKKTDQENRYALQKADADLEAAKAAGVFKNALTLAADAFYDLGPQLENFKLQSKIAATSGERAAAARKAGDIESAQAAVKSGEMTIEEALRMVGQSDMRRGFRQRFIERGDTDPLKIYDDFMTKLVESSDKFRDNMIDGIMQAVEGAGSLSDVLTNSALEFARLITRTSLTNLYNMGRDTLFGVQGYATGGRITGGSGTKDDVPAMLMGGEYVVKKDSVQKYGLSFMDSLNNGNIPKFAKGGYFAPGFYGQGAITGKKNLLDFATQAYTTGSKDVLFSDGNAAAISLEPESVRLSTIGRTMGTPMQRATEEAKGQAFDLYLQQMQREKELRQAEKERRKQLRNQLIMAAASTVAGAVGRNIFSGAQGALSDLGPGASVGTRLSTAFSGGMQGLRDFGSNTYQGVTSLFSGNFKSGFDSLGYAFNPPPRAIRVGPSGYTRATGGSIPSTSGIDTVPAMLSGGEFVMNNAAAKNIGTGNLNALNSGASSMLTEEKSEELNEKIINKLDELIESGVNGNGEINITVNNEGKTTEESGGDEQGQNFAKRIRDAVIRVIEEEKRLGGTLRRGLA